MRESCSNITTGKYLSLNGDMIVIFQNLAISEYMKTVFNYEDMASVLGMYGKSHDGNGRTMNMIIRLLERGRGVLI